jgi:hypothetical protein
VTPDPLPPELLALERELSARPQVEPSAELRSRVLAALSHERPTPRPGPVRDGFLRFAAATAAAVVVAINLSASLANNTDWRPPAAADDPAQVVDRLRAVDPDLSDTEARRQALVLRAAAGLAPAPARNRILHNREMD